MVFFGSDKKPSRRIFKYIGQATNNVAEYMGLIYALQAAEQAKIKRVLVKTDSQLLARQVAGQYRVRNSELIRLHGIVQNLRSGFEECRVEHIPREQNKEADRLAGEAVKSRSSKDSGQK